MPVKQPLGDAKSHMVSFRISSMEYRLLKALQPLHGARSFSDFARDTLLRQLANVSGVGENAQNRNDRELSARINLLQRDLERLRAMMPETRRSG